MMKAYSHFRSSALTLGHWSPVGQIQLCIMSVEQIKRSIDYSDVFKNTKIHMRAKNLLSLLFLQQLS